jgi:hypothetical protein
MMVFQMPVVLDPNSTVRYRVDLKYGYISYGAQDYAKAIDIYQREGLRLKVCRDIFDEGHVIMENKIDGE